jgi:AP-4 complex subunit mu-1
MSFMISQFYVLSPRGDSIIARDFRGDLPKGAAEIFFRNVKFWQGKQQDAPPVFRLDNVNYMYIKKNGLYLVCTTKYNISPAFTIELLTRLTKLFKDYCGVLTEESVRSNFVMIYELLEEVVDFGYVQNTQTEQLKPYVFNPPVQVQKAKQSSFKLPDMNPKTTPSTAVDKPISFQDKSKKNEIFVDIYERIIITFNSNGYILNQSIDGTIQMKSYLAGNPELKLALNEELVVGKGNAGTGGYGAVELDDCNFHECVKLNAFDSQRVLTFVPPDGEFVVMNYRITSDFRTPFRMFPFFELVSPYKVEVIVKVRADIPETNYGGNVVVAFPVPRSTSSAVCDLGVGVVGQSAEYDAKERKVLWKIKKFKGGTEQTLRARITLSAAHTATVRKEIGPISMQFEIPMYNPSNLQVRYLRILENKNYNPYRWVRYVTRSQSYVCRL